MFLNSNTGEQEKGRKRKREKKSIGADVRQKVEKIRGKLKRRSEWQGRSFRERK
jgi:hypothetical protein